MRGPDCDIGKGSQDHREVNIFQEYQQLKGGEDLKGKTNSAMDKLPAFGGLAIAFSATSEDLSSFSKTLSS